MASLKDLIVHGTSKFISNIFGNIIHANKFITNGGTSSQFVKGDGTLDDSTYLTSATTPQYTITKLTTAETGYIASYELKKDGTKVGDTINIPKDYLVKSGTIGTVTTSNVPYQGAVVGDKYLDFVVNTYDTSAGSGTTSHIYIPVNDLVDVYTKGNGIDISASNIVSVKIDSNNANGLSVGENGLSLSTATTTSSGAMSSTDKSKLNGIASGAEVNVQSDWNQTNTGADDYIKNKPNIGSLKTDNTTAQTPSASESFTGDINLHKISKTGSYNDLNDKPTIPSLPLSIANGGTGATTAKGAEYNINGGISEVTTAMTDYTQISMKYITPSTTNGVFYYKNATQIWDYIKSKIESILGIGGSNGVPTAPTASAGTNTTQIATTAFVNTSISNKADKVSGATSGNFAGLDASGNLTDSGSKASDFATSTHTHGNITNTGALQTNDITIASGDKLVVTDTSNSGKIARTSISFDGTTTNTALTPKGTFERFLQSSDLNTYWANQQLTSEAVYNTEPEFKTVTINGSTNSSTASTENGVLLYDTEEKCIKFMFN